MTSSKILFLLLAIFMVGLAGGCQHSTIPADPNKLEEWLAHDPESCLWYHSDIYPPIIEAGRYDSLEYIYGRLLRAMPYHPKKSKNLEYLTGWMLAFYHNGLIGQNKIKGNERFTDSLLNSPNPFFNQVMRPELLAYSARCYLTQMRLREVDSLGRIFSTLPLTNDLRRNARIWNDMAWTLESADIDPAMPISLIEKCVDACRQVEGQVGNEGEIYACLGLLYRKNGQLEQAVIALQESINWYNRRIVPGGGLTDAYNYLTRVYTDLGLHDKALETNALAIARSIEIENRATEETYRLRALCHSKAGQPDSALYWIHRAIEATPEAVDSFLLPNLQINRLDYFYASYPDSIGSCLNECLRLLKDTAHITPEARANLTAYYGMALLHTPGGQQKGIACIEQSFHIFQAGNNPDGILRIGEQLIRAYIHARMTERIADVYPIYSATRDSLQKETAIRAAIGADIRYETGRKEQENQTLIAKVSLKQRTLTFTWVVAGLLITLLCSVGLYFSQRQRYHRRISETRLAQISSLLGAQQDLHHNNQTLTEELEEVSRRKTTGNVRVQLSTHIFNPNEEANFRRTFTSLYPDYLPSLHQRCPELTRTDELIAMLLLLDLSNDEIALTLGIAKASVNRARSRLRKRLGLVETGVVLEEYLKGI